MIEPRCETGPLRAVLSLTGPHRQVVARCETGPLRVITALRVRVTGVPRAIEVRCMIEVLSQVVALGVIEALRSA